MYVVIGGAGEVGYSVAQSLVAQGHEVAVIDNDPEACRRVEALDALAIVGNVASPAALKRAYIESASFFLGLTGSDEVNLLACAVAKRSDCMTIARANAPEYVGAPVDGESFRHVGVDWLVCPDLVAATKMARIMTLPTILDAEIFAGGKVQVMDVRVQPGTKADGAQLKNIGIPEDANIVSIFRNADILIPTGDTVIEAEDVVVVVLANVDATHAVQRALGGRDDAPKRRRIRKAMIVGASRVGQYLSRLLVDRGVSVTLIDKDEDVCQTAAESLPKVLVIQGRGTDRDLLLEEDVSEADAFLAATEQEEYNTLSCILAKQLGAKRTIALVDKPALRNILQDIGLDVAVSPRQATVSTVLQKTVQSEVLSLSVLHTGEAVAYEVKVTEKSKIAGKRLKAIRPFYQHSRVGLVIRDRDVMIPKGEFQIQPGDRMVIFTTTGNIKKLEGLFR